MSKQAVGKISVVTVCLNVHDTIRLTLESVARQTFENIEHVIIDGGSNDGTQDIIREYDVGYFVSEKDNGVYHAMQKGAIAATGEVIIFLNAGDTFFDECTCEDVAKFFEESNADIVFGNLMPVYLRPTDSHDHGAFAAGKQLDLGYVTNKRQLYDESIHHQATFYRSWIFKHCSYICKYPEANGEYNVLLNAVMKHNAKVKHIPRLVARFVLGGISTRNFEAEWEKYVKARDILRKLYCPNRRSIKIESETEFHYQKPGAPRPKVNRKWALKNAVRRSFAFRIYERIILGFSARVINALMPKIENLLEVQTQRIFNDLSYVIKTQHASHNTVLQRQTGLLEKIEDMVAKTEQMYHGLREAEGHLVCLSNKVDATQYDMRSANTQLRINVAQVANKVLGSTDFSSSGYRVFSQWDEDGLIQYLVNHTEIINHTFVEIGVGDYSEANTRLLLQKDNWSGLIIDCNALDIEKVRSSELYWRYSLKAFSVFVTRENINDVLAVQGMSGEIGLLSIDVDGVDFWLWKALETISPQIVICEYNGIFGSTSKVTVPYEPDFDRTKKHYSWLYAGASLSALESLGREKGYTLIGTNSGGNNAFFLRDDVFARGGIKASSRPYTRPMFRESRNVDGSLSYLDIAEGVRLIAELPVYDLDRNALVKIQDLEISYC